MSDHTATAADQHPPLDYTHLSGALKRFGRRLLAVAENRLDLLMVEAEEERRNLLTALVLVAVMMGAALIGDLTISTLLVVLLWNVTQTWTLLALGVLHVGAAVLCLRRLVLLLRNRSPFAASADQLRKDRITLEKIL